MARAWRGTILWGSLPFGLLMVLGTILLCVFRASATWLPDTVMGIDQICAGRSPLG